MERGLPGISRAVYTTSRMARKTTLKPIAVPILPATLWSPKNDERRKIPREEEENCASTEDLNNSPNGDCERYAQRQKNEIGDTDAPETLKIHIWAFYTFPIIYALSSMRCYTFTACRGLMRPI